MKSITTSIAFITKEEKAVPTESEKLVTAFCAMDIRAFEDLLIEDFNCGDANKYDLIARIERQFEKLKAQGNTELIPVAGWCLGCKENACGYRFEGNVSGHKITYIITEMEEGKFNLTNCSYFQVPGEPMPEPF